MALLNRTLVIVLLGAIAVFYQVTVKPLVYDFLGVSRDYNLTGISSAKCQKLDASLGLEACEDMWLHQATGAVYMACGGLPGRVEWMVKLNAAGRHLTDRVAILDSRGSGRIESRLKFMTLEGFSGNAGDGVLDLHGMAVREGADGHLSILLINHRPPHDPDTGLQLEKIQRKNSTIELFHTEIGSTTMRHVKTFADESMISPNKAIFVRDDSDEEILWTNDHTRGSIILSLLEFFTGGGNVGYCGPSGCKIIERKVPNMPNGLIRDRDGFIWVPSSLDGQIWVYSLSPGGNLTKIADMKIPSPIDNLSLDGNGDIYAPTIPEFWKLFRSMQHPWERPSPSVIFRIRKSEDGNYRVDQFIGDEEAGATVAIHDSITGRIFLGGCFAPWVTVCEPPVATRVDDNTEALVVAESENRGEL